jgi:hypothetical protein
LLTILKLPPEAPGDRLSVGVAGDVDGVALGSERRGQWAVGDGVVLGDGVPAWAVGSGHCGPWGFWGREEERRRKEEGKKS